MINVISIYPGRNMDWVSSDPSMSPYPFMRFINECHETSTSLSLGADWYIIETFNIDGITFQMARYSLVEKEIERKFGIQNTSVVRELGSSTYSLEAESETDYIMLRVLFS